MKRIKYTSNQVINGLTFIKEIAPHILPCRQKQRKAIFKCYCGNKFEAMIGLVKKGNTNSCGCYKKARAKATNTTHGLCDHPLYATWTHIKQRCYNENDKGYKYYGGRGIEVSSVWLYDAKEFIGWCLKNGWQEGLTIDRINNNGDYSPNNCRFVSHATNCQNRRSTKLSQNKVKEIRSMKLLTPELTQQKIADIYGVDYYTVGDILRNQTWEGCKDE